MISYANPHLFDCPTVMADSPRSLGARQALLRLLQERTVHSIALGPERDHASATRHGRAGAPAAGATGALPRAETANCTDGPSRQRATPA